MELTRAGVNALWSGDRVLANLVWEVLWSDDWTTCIRGLAATGCKNHQNGFCGVPCERSMSISGLPSPDIDVHNK